MRGGEGGQKIQTTYPIIRGGGGGGKNQRCPAGRGAGMKRGKGFVTGRGEGKGIFPVAKTARAIYIYIFCPPPHVSTEETNGFRRCQRDRMFFNLNVCTRIREHTHRNYGFADRL